MNISLIIKGILIAVSLPAFTRRSSTILSHPIVTRALQLIGAGLVLIGIAQAFL